MRPLRSRFVPESAVVVAKVIVVLAAEVSTVKTEEDAALNTRKAVAESIGEV